MKNIYKALLNAQMKIENASKDGKNPHFKSKYATLESVLGAVKQTANECGIVIVQGNGADTFGQFVNTVLIYGESGETIDSKVYLLLDKNNMQGLGSAITYARRYGLASMFAIGQDDDDGNAASKQSHSYDTSTHSDIDANPPSGKYFIPFGKFKAKSIEEVPMSDLENYVIYLETKAKKDNKEITGIVKEFVDRAIEYLNSFEEYNQMHKD